MLRSPAFRALVGFGGTLCALGGATLAVSTATSAVIRVAVKTRQSKRMIPCQDCNCSTTAASSTSSSSSSLPGKRRCAVCRGRRAVRWQPFAAPVQARWTLCPLCRGSGEQLCWNCSGSGEVVGSDAEVKEFAEAKKQKAAEEATEAIAIR